MAAIVANNNINVPVNQVLNLPNVVVNPANCMSRKNKNTGLHLQCPYKKKDGDYCKIHSKMANIMRIDQPLLGQAPPVPTCPPGPPGPVGALISGQSQGLSPVKIPITKKTLKIIKPLGGTKNKKVIKIVKLVVEPYTPSEFRALSPNTVDYKRLILSLRHHLINVKGDRVFLFNQLADFFQYRWIDTKNMNDETLCKSEIENPLLERLSGPGYKDRKLCDNPADFYDLTELENIPDVYFFSFEGENDRIYGCDFRSFHQLVETSKQSLNNRDMNVPGKNNWEILNPYNRQLITDDVIKTYEEKMWLLKQNHIPVEYPQEEMDEETKLKCQVLETFQVMYTFGYPVDHKWFMDLSSSTLKDLYAKLEDIWNYRLQLTSEQKRKIVPNDDIFTSHEKNQVGKYGGPHPEDKKKLRKILLNVIRKMVTEGETKADCINGTIYVLTGLVEVSPDAANAMPGVVYIAGINDFNEVDSD